MFLVDHDAIMVIKLDGKDKISVGIVVIIGIPYNCSCNKLPT